MDFQRKGLKFNSLGVQLTRPVDLLAEHKYAILRNVRSYQDGNIHARLGIASPTAAMGAGPAHSIKRYYDSTSATSAEIVGSGTALYFNAASVSTGFSGNPLSFVSIRPFSAVENWIYVGDSSKQVKVNKTGTVRNIGLTPPSAPVSVALGGPAYTVVENFESLPNGWTNGGTAGAIALVAGKRVDTTIAQIVYDSGTTGWASVSPTAMTNGIQPGALLQVAGAEQVKVEEVFEAIADTTISSISYDSGTSGLCTIQLASPSVIGLRRDAMVRLAAAENVRVLSVTTGPDGLPSFRCSTTATRAAGNAVAGLKSFRAYFAGTRSAGNTLTAEAFSTSVTAGTGYIDKVAAFNLSTISSRPLKADDLIHISVRLDEVENLTEGKVFFNCDVSSTAFDKNYYYYPFTANSLTPAVTGALTTLTVQQNIITRTQIEGNASRTLTMDGTSYTRLGPPRAYYTDGGGAGPDLDAYPVDYVPTSELSPIPTPVADDSPTLPPGQTTTGDSQWSELVFKVSDLIRVGSDESCSLATVNALRIQFQVEDTTVCDVDSLWVGGTYGLEAARSDAPFPYNWTYRYRSQATGAVSNPAPPMRTGVKVDRNRAILTPTVSADAQVDLIDFFRAGGTLPEWHYIGTSPNSGTFTDSFSDESIAGNFGLEEDNFQPFPIIDAPRTGTCDVVGTEVTRVSGDNFNTAWARGSQIIINGTPTSLYSAPSSTTKLSVEDNLGTLTGVTFVLPSPTLMGQTVTALWGPYSVSGVNFMFGCKDGTLYYTKGNNPDSAPETHQLELTPPSEPLVGGCVYDGQSYVFSTERMFRVIPTAIPDAIFEAQEVPVSKGLMAPWSLCVDELITFVSRDGIYQTNGTEVKSISDADLYPLFPHDGQVGSTVNGIAAPDYTTPSGLRLAAGDGLIKFTFKDTGATYRTWVYDTRHKGWISLDTYNPQVVCHYWDEGGASGGVSAVTRERVGTTTGRVYTANSGTTDDGNTVTSQVRTRSEDVGDTRAMKLFGDLIIDHSGDITVTPGFDNYSSLLGSQSFSLASRGLSIMDLTSGGGKLGRNIALDVTFTSAGTTAFLNEWQPSFIPRPEDSKLRFMDWDNAGYNGDKRVTGFLIKADTFNTAKSFDVQYDGGTSAGTFSITHDGPEATSFALATPVIAKLLRISTADADKWQIFDVQYEYEKYPENLARIPDFENDGDLTNKWLMGFELEVDTSNLPVTLQLQGDGGTVLQTYEITHNGRLIRGYDLDTPAITHAMRLVPTSGSLRDFRVRWVWVPYPENWAATPPFENGGTEEAKWLQGFELEADTLNLPVTVQLQGDEGAILETYTITHNGKVSKPYVLTPPVVTHNMRLVPTSGTGRFFAVKWIWEPSPESVTHWQNQGTSHGFEDYHHLRRIWVALQSSDTVTLTINIDGTDYTYSIPSTSGVYAKKLLPLQAVKGKLYTYTFSGASPFRLFLNDSVVEALEWGSSGPYKNVRPFGAIHHYQTQARI